MLHTRIAAIGADGTFIGNDLREIEARVLEAICSRKHLRPYDAPERLVARKRAAIIYVARIYRGNYAISIESHARIEERALVAVSAGQKMLRTRFGPFDRAAADLARGERAHGHVRIIRDLDSESAADIDAMNADLIDPNAERRREELRRKCGEGIIGVEIDALGLRIPIADDGVVFERRA